MGRITPEGRRYVITNRSRIRNLKRQGRYMKLRVEPQPESYTADKAVMLIDEDIEEQGGVIVLGCENASHVANAIKSRINLFPSLVAALTPFSSKEMGNLLIDALEEAMQNIDKNKAPIMKGKLTRLINAVDVILKGVELMKEREEQGKNIKET